MGWEGEKREGGKRREGGKGGGSDKRASLYQQSGNQKVSRHPVLGNKSTYWRSFVEFNEATEENNNTIPSMTTNDYSILKPSFL